MFHITFSEGMIVRMQLLKTRVQLRHSLLVLNRINVNDNDNSTCLHSVLRCEKTHGITPNIVMVTEREGNNSKTVSNKQEQLPFHQYPSTECDICFSFAVSRLEEKQDNWK